MEFLGPGKKLRKRPALWQKVKNRLDALVCEYDIAYSKAKNLRDKWSADRIMIKAIDAFPGKKRMQAKVKAKL